MTNTLPKLIGAVAVVAVMGGAVVMMKGPRQDPQPSGIPVPPPVINLATPPVVTPAKPKIKRDMLDYEEPAPTQNVVKAPAPAPVAPTTTLPVPTPGSSTTPGSNFNLATIPPPLAAAPQQTARAALEETKTTGQMKLESAQLLPGKKIPLAYTCYQKNISPSLNWSGAPSGTKNFAIVLEGPDKGRGHPLQWGVYNIPASQTSLPEGLSKTPSTDKGAQAETDVGPIGYAGPCVPKGEVTYTFSVFALDTELKLRPGATRDELFKAMNGHILDTAKLSAWHYYRL